MGRRSRRTYTAEFKAEAVGLAAKDNRSIETIATGLGIPKTTLVQWVRLAARAGKTELAKVAVSEGEEVRQLREEVRTLRMERDFLKKAAAFFAKYQS